MGTVVRIHEAMTHPSRLLARVEAVEARRESLSIVTIDAAITRCDVETIW